MAQAKRSMATIDSGDLNRLAAIAREDREELFARNVRLRPLAKKIICVALCQGAALHYVDGKNGVKDFDVWTFFRNADGIKFPPRRLVSRDFGSPKFGKSPDRPDFVGRRVDLLGRSLELGNSRDPAKALRRYLADVRTQSARCLSQKAIVLLAPADLRGTVVWPISNKSRGDRDVKSGDIGQRSKPKKSAFTPLRFFAKRRDATVGTTERQIERMLQLPSGCVRLVLPRGRKARADKTIGSVLHDYGW
jgi:hypothetical protein